MTRDTVIAAAERLTVEYGLRWTTTEMAERAGISRGQLYRAFPVPKRDVVAELLDVDGLTGDELRVLEQMDRAGFGASDLDGWRQMLSTLRAVARAETAP